MAEATLEELGYTEKCVYVPVLVEVFCGNEIAATGETEAVAALVPLVTA